MFIYQNGSASGQTILSQDGFINELLIGIQSAIKSTMATSCPAFRVAAATQASPKGKVGIAIFSVFAEMSRTLMVQEE